MLIVIVCDFGEINGGAAKVAITSARSLAETGFAVRFICAVGPVSALLDHPRIEVHCLDMSNVWSRRNPAGAAVQAIWNGAARKAVLAILARIPDDEAIVHFHQWTKAFSPSVLDAAARRGLPAIVSLHDYFIACPNGAYYHYGRAEPCRLTPMSIACVASNCDRSSYVHKLVRVVRQWATSLAVARAGPSLGFLSVSPLAQSVIDRFLPRGHPRFVVRSPIEAERDQPVAVAENREFLFVGRLTQEKGVALLADVARSAGFPLAIVGDGPLLEELRQLGGEIRCAGWLDGAGVGDAMRQARALVFPSTWHETGGLVVLEALAQGLPVIVSRVTAPADFIEDGVNGFLVDPEDRVALRDRMNRLTDESVARRMGDAAYRRYWDDPQTAERHTQGLVAAYRTMLSHHGAATASAAPVGAT